MDVTSWVTPRNVGLAIGLSAVMFAGSVFATIWASLRLPPDYFLRDGRPLPLEGQPRWVRIAARIGMNVLGLALVVAGLLMMLPGVPGQGLLTVLVGVLVADFPGKKRVERAIFRRKLVRSALGKLRARYGRPPLLLPEDETCERR